MKLTPFFVGLTPVVLYACAPNPIKEQMLTLRVSEAEQTCRVALQGQHFDVPEDQQRLETALRAFAERRVAAVVEPSGSDLSYRCLGSVIFLAQKAGIVRVGFVAEPSAVEGNEH